LRIDLAGPSPLHFRSQSGDDTTPRTVAGPHRHAGARATDEATRSKLVYEALSRTIVFVDVIDGQGFSARFYRRRSYL